MPNLINKLEKTMPFWEFLSKIKKLFSSSKSFWSLGTILVGFVLSQLIAIGQGERLSKVILSTIHDDTNEWLKLLLELLAEYFEGGSWVYVGVAVCLLLLIAWMALHGDKDLTKMDEKLDTLVQDKSTEKYLIQRIETLERQLLDYTSHPTVSHESIVQLSDEIIQLKSKLYALQIDDKVIYQAQAIIEKEQKEGVPRALELIESSNQNQQLQKLREQNQKQAKISRYKAGLYEWINAWEKANRCYLEVIEFQANFDNYFEYAYFLQSKQADFKEAEKFYTMALQKTDSVVKKATILNNLANFHADDSSKRTQAEGEYEEALKIRRALAKENPKVYLSDVAMSLNNLGAFHAQDSSKRTQAEGEYEEALKIYRALAKENPKVYLSYVATSLNNLGAFHADDSSKRTQAEGEFEEALKIYRDLAQENPKVYGRDCANTLVMGVYFFGASKENLDEALRLLEPYDDGYMNVGLLRKIIGELK